MPIYFYQCSSCENVLEHWASMSDYKDQHPACVECGSITNNVFKPSVSQVIYKDGPSGSWPSKGNRFQNYRREASEAAGKRQRDRFGDTNKLVPNYNGKETESWREAQNEAVKERGAEASVSYEPLVQKEKPST